MRCIAAAISEIRSLTTLHLPFSQVDSLVPGTSRASCQHADLAVVEWQILRQSPKNQPAVVPVQADAQSAAVILRVASRSCPSECLKQSIERG